MDLWYYQFDEYPIKTVTEDQLILDDSGGQIMKSIYHLNTRHIVWMQWEDDLKIYRLQCVRVNVSKYLSTDDMTNLNYLIFPQKRPSVILPSIFPVHPIQVCLLGSILSHVDIKKVTTCNSILVL